jgi:hypothetical protein
MVWTIWGIHTNAMLKMIWQKKINFNLMKFTSLQFGVKLNFPRLPQNKMYMSFVVFHVLLKNENLIYVMDHEIIQVLVKDIIHHVLQICRCICKAKGIMTYSKWPIHVWNMIFHSLSFWIHTKLYAPFKLIFVYILAWFNWFNNLEIKGKRYGFFMVNQFKSQ